MAAMMIGVDPHTGSHTAVVVGPAEKLLGQVRVRACAEQAERLLAWAAAWPERTWAIEGAGGRGHLLAQQLVAAGERVLDVQPSWPSPWLCMARAAAWSIATLHACLLGERDHDTSVARGIRRKLRKLILAFATQPGTPGQTRTPASI